MEKKDEKDEFFIYGNDTSKTLFHLSTRNVSKREVEAWPLPYDYR